MKLNKRQKTTIMIAFIFIAIALIVWIAYGANIFTKTKVLVEKKDELFGTTYKEWQDKLVLGLDYISIFMGAVVVIAGIFIFQFKSRNKES
jgi:hypothetical protein